MAKLSALGFVGFAKEPTWGTETAPTLWLPTLDFSVEEKISKIVDEARRGNLSKDFNVLNGQRSATIDLTTNFYTDRVGFLLAGIFGGVTSQQVGDDYEHTFQLVNTLPPSFTATHYNGIEQRNNTGAVIEEVSLKWDAEKLFEISAKMQAKVFGGAPTGPSANDLLTDVSDPLLGYGCSFSLNGSPNLNLVGAEVTLKREVKLLFGANATQDPTKFAAGRLEVTGKLTFDVEDMSEYNLYMNQGKQSLEFTFGDASSGLVLTFSKVDFEKANVDTSNEWVRVDAEFRAIYNPTDAGPCAFVLKNSKPTVY